MVTPNHNANLISQIELEPREIWVCETARVWVARLRHHPENPGLRIRPLLSLDQWFTLRPDECRPILVWEYQAKLSASDWEQLTTICEKYLVFSVGGREMVANAAWLRLLGIAAVMPGALSAARILQLAGKHFETLSKVDKPLEDRIQNILPWSN